MTEPLPFKHPDAEVATVDEQLEAIATEIEAIQATAIVKIGEKLHEARAIHRDDQGGFRAWVERRLSMSRSTAYNMISVYEQLGSSVQVLDTLGREALYALAAPSTPPEVRDEVEALLIDGEKVTAADIRRMRDEARAAADGKTAAEREAERLRAQVKNRNRNTQLTDEDIQRQAEAKAEELVEAAVKERLTEARSRDQRTITAMKRAEEEFQRKLKEAERRAEAAEAKTAPPDATNVVALDLGFDDEDDDQLSAVEAVHAVSAGLGTIYVAAERGVSPSLFWEKNSDRINHEEAIKRISACLTVLAVLISKKDDLK